MIFGYKFVLKLVSFILCLFLNVSYAENFLDTDHLPLGEDRIDLGHQDFRIEIENPAGIEIKAMLDKDSIQWIRYDEVLLIPRARLKIRAKKLPPATFISYKEKTINLQHSKQYSYAELNISLYERHLVELHNTEGVIARLRILFKPQKKPRIITDYTCSRNNIKVTGLHNEQLSLGCRTRRIGPFGKERPMLEVTWISPELRIKNAGYIPYTAAFLSDKPVNIEVVNIFSGEAKTLTITASIPKRLHRLFTAYGFGPYAFETQKRNNNGELLTKSEPTVPALMFYINYKISETNSIRGFEAAVFKDSTFNNAGLYLGSDFGFALDNKLYFSTLIGVQYLYFKFDEDSPVVSEAIFPQGLEFMYRHAFDIPNYIISGGIFLSPSADVDYTNVWIRWGKKYFWELNLISWGKEDFKASTYGVSLGFPFKGFL